MMRKNVKQIISCLLTAALVTTSVTVPMNVKTADAASVISVTNSPARVSVHDPSIVEATDGYYYIFGSHIEAAKSKDLVNWTRFTNGYATTNNVIYGNLAENLKKPFEWAGEKSDTDDGTYHVWAPDVFWNEEYVNEDGSTGAYMMYFCTTSTWNRSVLAYGVSKDINGPYTTVDTLIYSGFADSGSLDYKRTNIDELINDGTLQDGLNSNWFSSGSYNTLYAPNAIDPTVFYDKDGKTLWMTYGSWSGGIFVLQLDPKTGAAIYPGKNSTTADGLVVDEYFGTRIAGGYGKSGEGPYILYDEDSDYYYLYVTYEGLEYNGGYNMRLFRSKNPDGPYLDAAGNDATVASREVDHNVLGIKVMGNYKFSCLSTAYMAPGHNSALVDSDGQRYLINHTRFLDRTWLHEVRVHQQFINEAGWPVTAVFENEGDVISETGYATESIVGDYEYINHGTTSDGGSAKNSQNITLNANGTISGSVTGTWEAKEGTYYMNAVIGGVTYSGVFFLQHDEASARKKVMTFTAIGTNNETIWGVRKEAYTYTDSEIVERAADDLDASFQLSDKTMENIELPTEGFQSSVITWSSSNTSVISNDGKVTRPETDTEVTLTATITKGSASATRSYTTIVLSNNIKPDYRYDFETVTDGKTASTGSNTAEASLTGSATVTDNTFAGKVLTIKSNAGVKDTNYLKLPSDIFSNVGSSGFTVSMWAKKSSSTLDDSALFEAKSTTGSGGLPAVSLFAGAYGSLKSYEGNATGSPSITPDSDTWNHIALVVTRNGITTYVNGSPSTSQNGDLSNVLTQDALSKINDIRIGSGSLLGSDDVANVSFDNIEFYSVALKEADLLARYEAEKNSYPNLSLSASRSTIFFGGDTNKTATLSVDCDTNLNYETAYSSSSASIASVNSSGKVTAKKAGTATITATVTSGDKTQTLTKKITVKKAYLKISKKKNSLKEKKSFTFKAKGYGLKAKSVTWSSSKSSVLSINKKTGKATAKKKGTAKITAKYKSFKVSMKVKVTAAKKK